MTSARSPSAVRAPAPSCASSTPRRVVPCEAGRTGEIVIVGDTVAKGYFRNPEKTAAAAFFDATLVDGTPVRAYRTGDAGHLDESGRLDRDGRFDSLVKVNGFRIELADVEENLGALPLVKQAAVVPVRRRERVAYLKACVVLRERPAGSDFEIARLIRLGWPSACPATWCRDRWRSWASCR